MSTNALPQTGSQTWQPAYIGQHQAHQSQYLETVSASGFGQLIATQAMALLGLQPGQHVLEVGCGNGVFLPRLCDAVGPGGRVVGIDHAEAFVAEAQAKAAALPQAGIVSVQQADAYRLPFADASFDAAHCERVLMHLDDPDAALREMARVLKPGGILVAAEPDWAGIRIDHPERAAFDRLFAQALYMRQTDMGLTLHRRLAAAGLQQLRHNPAWGVFDDFNTFKLYGLNLARAADELAAAGQMARGQADGLIAALEATNEARRFYATAAFHVASGRKPG